MMQALPLRIRRGLHQDALRPANDHFAHLLPLAHCGNPCGHEEERLRCASEIEGREPGVSPVPSCRIWDLAPSDKSDNGREGSIIAPSQERAIMAYRAGEVRLYNMPQTVWEWRAE